MLLSVASALGAAPMSAPVELPAPASVPWAPSPPPWAPSPSASTACAEPEPEPEPGSERESRSARARGRARARADRCQWLSTRDRSPRHTYFLMRKCACGQASEIKVAQEPMMHPSPKSKTFIPPFCCGRSARTAAFGLAASWSATGTPSTAHVSSMRVNFVRPAGAHVPNTVRQVTAGPGTATTVQVGRFRRKPIVNCTWPQLQRAQGDTCARIHGGASHGRVADVYHR